MNKAPRMVPPWTRLACILVVGMIVCSQIGCSLMVMTGKMLFGNPKVTSAFKQMSGVDLTDGKKNVVVICSTPKYIAADYPTLNFDLTEGVTRRLKVSGIRVVDSQKVTRWIDDQGGYFEFNPDKLAREFETDYIVYIDIRRFDYREENSPELFRGRMHGTVKAYEIREVNEVKLAHEVFVQEVTSVYPNHHPVSTSYGTARTFRKRYLDIVSANLARMFYDHYPRDAF